MTHKLPALTVKLCLTLLLSPLLLLASPHRDATAAKSIVFTDDGSAIPPASEYIQDGLVAMWDGVENVGYNVHHPRPSAWIDLIGGSTFSITSADTITKNGIVFNRAVVSSTLRYDTNKVYSVFHTCRFYNPTRSSKCIFLLLSVGTSSSVGAYSFNEGIPIRVFRGVNWRTMVSQSEWPADDTFAGQIGISYSVIKSADSPTNLCVMYRNGQQFYALRGPSWYFNYDFYSSGSYRINTPSAVLEQEVYSIKIYDRELSPEEVAYNYDLDRLRFNLP